MSSAVVGDTEGGPPPSHLSLPADIRARYRGWSPAPPIVIRGSGVAVCDSLTFACWPDAQSPSPEFYEVHDEHLQRVSLVAVYPLPSSVQSTGISRLPATSSSSNGGRTAQTTGLVFSDPQQYATQEVRDDVHLSKFLTHPRFPRVYHTHSLPNALLVVSPKHTGGSLVDWLCQRRVDGQLVDATVVQRLMKCVLQGLDALHSEALIHRGITHHALVFPEVDARGGGGREVQGEGGSATCQGGTEASVKLGHLRGVAVASHVRPEDECGPSLPCRRRAPHSSSCQQHRPDLHDTAYHGNLLYTAPEILRTMLLPLPQHTGDAAAEAQRPTQADNMEALPAPDRGRACVSDMWSVGVLCHLLLSGHFPFEEAQRVEVEEGKWETIVASRVPTPWDLVQRLTKGINDQAGGYDSYLAAYRDALAVRGGLPPGNHFQWLGGSREATDFVVRCLTADPALRLTARDALKHPWMTATAFGREQWESSDQRGSTATHQLKRQLHRLCERLLPSNTSTAFVSLLESSRRPSGEGPLPPLFPRCDGWMEDMILHEGATAWLGAERELIAAFVQRTEERRQELAVAKDPYAHISLTTSDSSCSASASTGQKMISSRIVAAPSVAAAAGAAAKPSRSCDTLLSELLVGRYTVPACLPPSAAAFSYLSQLDLSLGCTHFLGESHCISLLLSLRSSVHTAARLSTLRLCQQGVSDRVLEAWRVDLCEASGSPSSVPSRLVPFSQLRVLDFSSNVAVTAEGVRTLTRLVRWRGGALFPQLEQVDCSGCAVADTVLRKLGAAVRSSSIAVQ